MSCVAKSTTMSYHAPQETQNRVDAIKKKFEDNNGDKPEKPAVKRTPAFRCDRIVCGKNVTNTSKTKPTWTAVQSDSEAKISPPAVKFKKSFSENNVPSNMQKTDYNVKFISHEKDLLRTEPKLPQYAVVQKKKDTPDLNDPVRLALQSPLPSGPPPKKPPRLFTHTPAKEAKEDARQKLEKLENFILKHNSHVIVPRRGEEASRKDGAKESEQCGLGRLSCLSECVMDDGNVYVLEKKSSAVNCDRGKENVAMKNASDIVLGKIKSGEPIYAQPYLHKSFETAVPGSGGSFQTFGKLSPPVTPVTETVPPLSANPNKTDQHLHYMCTDLTQPSKDWSQEPTLKLSSDTTKPFQLKLRTSATVNKIDCNAAATRNASTAVLRTKSTSSLSTFSPANPVSSSGPASTPSPSITPGTVLSAIESFSQPLLASIGPLKPTRAAPNVPSSALSSSPPKRAENVRRSQNPLPVPARKTSSNCSSPPNVSPSDSPLDDVRRMMDKAFGRTASLNWDSDTSGQESPEDTPSLEFVPKTMRESSSSSPSLTSISSQTDDETLSRLAAKRKVYVKRVSSHLLSTDRKMARSALRENGSSGHLFESCLLIGLTLTEGSNGAKNNLPYVKSFFPTHVKPPPLIEHLCFPDADAWPPPASQSNAEAEQQYSIVLTNEKGERKFGYCRRVLPEGSEIPIPLAYCIISPHRAPGFYYTVLEELESRHGTAELQALISELYDNEFPNPGQSLKLTKILETAKMATTRRIPPEDLVPSTLVRRPFDERLENRDVTQLFRHLTIPIFLKVFSSILHERKVLILGNSLSALSECIEGLQSVLSPFSWQHTYVPVLPAHLLALCEAPTPYIIGVLKKPDTEATLSSQFAEGIVVDLEERRIISSCKDEGSILPRKLRKSLRSALTLATTADSAVTLPDAQKNVLVSEAFLRFFVEVCGHYERHISPQSDGSRVFQKESFIHAGNSSSIQSFLEWFTETALFHMFIKDRVEYSVHDLFWKRCYQHHDHAESASRLRGGNKKVKTLGDRIKDLATFSR